MFIVITGLDGSGTSSIAKKIHEVDKDSYLFRTPSAEYSDRVSIDENLRGVSSVAHMLYYLSSNVYISDYIKQNCDYKNRNVYVVRYLIDTVVSNRVAGIPLDLDYNIYGNSLLVPDLTIFINLDEEIRQKRLADRGKDSLDRVLDSEINRSLFLEEFNKLLDPEKTLYINNEDSIDNVASGAYQKVRKYNIIK